MNIDAFTFVSQILNFLLLLFILRRFLYGPLARIIRDRQEYIRSTVETAEDRLREAEDKKEAYQAELNSMESQRKIQMERLGEEVAEYREAQIKIVRDEVESRKTEFMKHLDSERDALLDDLIASICLNIGDFLVDVFVSLSNSSLENSVLDKFLDEIGNFPNESVEKINKSSGNSLLFVSSFELNASQRALVEKTLRKKCIACETLVFRMDREIGLGNKIVAGSLTINSSIREIVNQFRARLSQATLGG
ncbi:MAG: hypothetical protein LBU15_03340 [Rickettsiales bacterium]|jgi:F-type H+-transporting ATPase subunit b|nr:hypothetical protein [Rickettsiales bacterium]